jgi:hypothetical protein
MSKDGRFLRWFAAMGLALMAMLATAQVTTGSEQTEPASPHVRVVSGPELPQRILLIPVDDRPAVTQFPQMIGAMAGATIETPPRELIGRFTQPGKPEAIMAWMGSQNLKDYDAVVVSMDMIAYGGLIASRVERTSYNLAIQRIRQFWALRRTAPQTKSSSACGSKMRSPSCFWARMTASPPARKRSNACATPTWPRI